MNTENTDPVPAPEPPICNCERNVLWCPVHNPLAATPTGTGEGSESAKEFDKRVNGDYHDRGGWWYKFAEQYAGALPLRLAEARQERDVMHHEMKLAHAYLDETEERAVALEREIAVLCSQLTEARAIKETWVTTAENYHTLLIGAERDLATAQARIATLNELISEARSGCDLG